MDTTGTEEKVSFIDETDVFIGEREISRKEMEKDPSSRFYYMLQQFFRGACMKTMGNDYMVKLYFHAIMGAYLKDYTIIKGGGATDLRVPIIWVQNSGSGKSQLNKYSLDVCNRMGLRAVEETEFTTPGLIGTFDRAAHDFNIKNNLHPGDNVDSFDANGKKKSKTYRPPVIYGDMYYHDILFVDEGKVLFNPSKHTENILSVLQPAMDYPGRVRKKLAAQEPVEYDCSCTLVTSTVEFAAMNVEVMRQGFFQRCLFFQRTLSVFDYAKMHNELHRIFFDEADYNESINNVCDAIARHPFPIARDRHKIMVKTECLEQINGFIQSWFRLIREKLYGSELMLAQSFVSRMDMFFYKIAGQMAVMNNHLNPHILDDRVFLVGSEEIEYAQGMLQPLFDGLMRSMRIKESAEDKDMYSTVMTIMKSMMDKNVATLPKKDVISILMRRTATGRERALKLYGALISANFLTEKRVEKNVIVVEPNWKLWNEKTTSTGGAA